MRFFFGLPRARGVKLPGRDSANIGTDMLWPGRSAPLFLPLTFLPAIGAAVPVIDDPAQHNASFT